MNTVLVTACETFPYAGETRSPGDVFEASEKDAELLSLIGKVQRVDRVAERSMATADDADATTSTDAAPRRRRYQRKDLAAE